MRAKSPRDQALKLADQVLHEPTTLDQAIELAKVYALIDLADATRGYVEAPEETDEDPEPDDEPDFDHILTYGETV